MIFRFPVPVDYEDPDKGIIEFPFQVEDICFWSGDMNTTRIVFINGTQLVGHIDVEEFELALKEQLEILDANVQASLETDFPEYASHRVFYILDDLRLKYDNALEGDSKKGGSKPGAAFGD